MIFLGLIGMGVWWVIKTTGQAGQQYTEAMIKTSNKATDPQVPDEYADDLPEPEYLRDQQRALPGVPGGAGRVRRLLQLFHCPDPNGSQYVYIPGQGGDMPPTNVLVYETKPVHDGRCNVLFLGGQIEALTPEQLKQAVEATLAKRR